MKMPSAFVLAVLTAASSAACGRALDRQTLGAAAPPTKQSAEFQTLYAQNCAGCHGENGEGGVAIALNDPVYLAIASDDVVRDAIASGGPGTLSPAFARSSGGMLTGQQITELVKGIRAWATPGEPTGGQPPRYAASSAGDPAHGANDYRTFCASCHGPEGAGTKKAGSIVDPSFLSLVSDQDLRTLVIVGRPELGFPDWRDDLNGQPLTDRQVTDVVAWLASHRIRYPGQPYPGVSSSPVQGGNQ
jgi:mono/diheme cytochrome c family protein